MSDKLFFEQMEKTFGEKALINTPKAAALAGCSRQWLLMRAKANKVYCRPGLPVKFSKDDIVKNHACGWHKRARK